MPSRDVIIRCRDVLTLCDGYGCAFLDSHEFVCVLAAGHAGPHRDEFEHDGKSVVIEWYADNGAVSITDDA